MSVRAFNVKDAGFPWPAGQCDRAKLADGIPEESLCDRGLNIDDSEVRV
jgi:hypothetical protein